MILSKVSLENIYIFISGSHKELINFALKCYSHVFMSILFIPLRKDDCENSNKVL